MAKSRMSKAEKKKLALVKVKDLLKRADSLFKTYPELAHRCAKDARRSAMKVNLVLPSELKRRICRKCEHLLVPGANCRIRTTDHHVVMKCMDCGNISRFGFLREQKASRKIRFKPAKE